MPLSEPLILASTSPYRRTLLERLALPFEAISPTTDETRHPGEPPADLVRRLAEAKARDVGSRHAGLIIGSDQVACCGDDILGKPGDHERAAAQLKRLSGREVVFLTGLCLLNTKTGLAQVDVVPFTVTFRKLGNAQIENYLLKDRPYNCAGSFKSEGLGITLFSSMQGDDPSALIGLPLIRLTDMLAREGVCLPL